jgi:hypothetical protein
MVFGKHSFLYGFLRGFPSHLPMPVLASVLFLLLLTTSLVSRYCG